jgi:hypothetical protein
MHIFKINKGPKMERFYLRKFILFLEIEVNLNINSNNKCNRLKNTNHNYRFSDLLCLPSSCSVPSSQHTTHVNSHSMEEGQGGEKGFYS